MPSCRLMSALCIKHILRENPITVIISYLFKLQTPTAGLPPYVMIPVVRSLPDRFFSFPQKGSLIAHSTSMNTVTVHFMQISSPNFFSLRNFDNFSQLQLR